MYKNKYLKYKNKYLDLKNQITQKGGSAKSPNWDCTRCTYENNSSSQECSMCYQPKYQPSGGGGGGGGNGNDNLPNTITNEMYRSNIPHYSLYYNPTCLHTKLSNSEITRKLEQQQQNTIAENERVRRRIEEITSNPAVVLSEQEYANLTQQQKQLGWEETTEGNQHDGFETLYRRQTAQDINDEHNRNILAQMNNILVQGFQMIRVNNILPKLAIGYERNTYVQLTQSQYNDYKRLESQLRN